MGVGYVYSYALYKVLTLVYTMCYSCYGFDRNHGLVLHILVLHASMWLCLFFSISSLHGKDLYILFMGLNQILILVLEYSVITPS